MEHGRHLAGERAWLLNFYMIVLGAFIDGLLRGMFSKEVLRLASIILAGFSFIALATTLKLNVICTSVTCLWSGIKLQISFERGLLDIRLLWSDGLPFP